jgi:aspartyl/glutamyl-tRNA(Asn/Gln) amidotransferase C subunit
MAQVTYPGSENASFREDEAHENFTQEQALANAPEQGAGSFKVPSVIERED